MFTNFCPECLRRRERLFVDTPLYDKFIAGHLVNGQCERCVYSQSSSLEDTSEFILPTIVQPVVRSSNAISTGPDDLVVELPN